MKAFDFPLGARLVIVCVAAMAMLPSSGFAGASEPRDGAYGWDGRPIEAPVPLELRGKSRELVRLGSYLVNVAGGCNDCHSAGPQTEYTRGGNPYFGQPTVVNPATYLGGGRSFGSLIPGSPAIISRNLTPDKTGRPGGRSYSEFQDVFRTGTDLAHAHPSCSAAVMLDCLPAPFDGDLLQIMPWPAYRSMQEWQIRAIYEYLRAVPCIEGPPAPSLLHNDCY
jgi:hypothetical protein